MNQSHVETMRRLLQSAVDSTTEFDTDQEISGADLVEWFALWRSGVKATLEFIAKEESN